MNETRRWPRMALALEVSMRFPNEGAIEAVTGNISREGLFICMDPPKPLGTHVRVRLLLAETRETFVLEGVIVHAVPDPDEKEAPQRPPGVGVFLTNSSAGWGRFVETLAERVQRAHEHPRPKEEPPVVEEKVRDGVGKGFSDR